MKNGRKRRECDWVSRQTMCHVLGVTGSTFDGRIRPQFPDDCTRGEGKKLQFYGRGCLDAWAASTQAPPGMEDGLWLGGGSSPAFERWREARATLAELDLAKRQGQLLGRNEVHEMLGRVASILRGAGDMLQREFGPEAHRVLDEALDDAEREIAGQFE